MIQPDRCYRVWDAECKTWCHIPVCDGAAYNGPDQCLCDYKPTPRLEDKINSQRREIEALRADLEACRNERARLWNENMMMRRGRPRP